jgi:hypothetical protein
MGIAFSEGLHARQVFIEPIHSESISCIEAAVFNSIKLQCVDG